MSSARQQPDEPVQRMSRAEFRAWADAQPCGRYERVHRVVIAMAPERAAHVRLKAAAWEILRNGIRTASLACEATIDGLIVESGTDHDFIPDVVVRCGPRLSGSETVAPEPMIVVEVLSPSTSTTDRTTKLEAYFQLPSVQHYLIVSSDRVRVVHHRRTSGGIEATEHLHGAIALAPPGLTLDVAELYAEALPL